MTKLSLSLSSVRRLGLRALLVMLPLFTLASCFSGSHEAYEAKRRQTLLEMYPPGKTTRADVEKRFGHKPQETFERPQQSWTAHPDWLTARYGERAEKRIGKKIPLAERYYGADGMFSLCYCWFYYDRSGKLLDTEWQWSSD